MRSRVEDHAGATIRIEPREPCAGRSAEKLGRRRDQGVTAVGLKRRTSDGRGGASGRPDPRAHACADRGRVAGAIHARVVRDVPASAAHSGTARRARGNQPRPPARRFVASPAVAADVGKVEQPLSRATTGAQRTKRHRDRTVPHLHAHHALTSACPRREAIGPVRTNGGRQVGRPCPLTSNPKGRSARRSRPAPSRRPGFAAPSPFQGRT